MRHKCLCIVSDTPFVLKFKSYYVLNAFEKNNYKIILIDISPFMQKAAYETVKVDLIDYSRENVFLCKSYKELYKVLDTLPSGSIAITPSGWNREYYPIYNYFYKKGICHGHMILNSCYEEAEKAYGVKKIKEYIERLSLKTALNTIFVRLPRKLFYREACSFVITNSYREIEGYKRRFLVSEKTKYLVVHSNEYEEALSCKEVKRVVDEKYCVWLDSYIPYHPDNAMLGAFVEAEAYYKSLRKFFHWIEEQYGMKVIIAAHPRSDYGKHPEAYEGFKIIKGYTCLLVRDAEFVMTAASLSFLYAVVYQKPLLFIYQNALKEGLPSHIRFMDTLCRNFMTEPINIDEFDYTTRKLIDQRLEKHNEGYLKCANQYIKQGFDGTIDGESYEEVIINFLEEIE